MLAHQDCLEQQQQHGEADHEEALDLSALELRPEHEAVSCRPAEWWGSAYVWLGRTVLRSRARESSSSWLPFSMTDGESGPSRVSVARSAMFEAASSGVCRSRSSWATGGRHETKLPTRPTLVRFRPTRLNRQTHTASALSPHILPTASHTIYCSTRLVMTGFRVITLRSVEASCLFDLRLLPPLHRVELGARRLHELLKVRVGQVRFFLRRVDVGSVGLQLFDRQFGRGRVRKLG